VKRCEKSESTLQAIWMPSFSMTTKLAQSTKLSTSRRGFERSTAGTLQLRRGSSEPHGSSTREDPAPTNSRPGKPCQYLAALSLGPTAGRRPRPHRRICRDRRGAKAPPSRRHALRPDPRRSPREFVPPLVAPHHRAVPLPSWPPGGWVRHPHGRAGRLPPCTGLAAPVEASLEQG
jgi:hypothetical protein